MIQLKLKGVMSGFDTRIPTQKKLDMFKYITQVHYKCPPPIGLFLFFVFEKKAFKFDAFIKCKYINGNKKRER